ncbi:hypothetical protein CCR75_002172 [Bremia lactucae]|uniref:C5orf34-like C-terminal domain-containing protein n=1 Tax=Bremia lactucae TaxID=4779 RepID=A0A976FS46_BRELC|nr:hypothetical protein CCR75_002172 [Bremia lactucae]
MSMVSIQKGFDRRRCVLLMDGSAIGCYQRNLHETHIVMLAPSSHTYTYIQPDGTCSRHLTPTALSRHRPIVIDTLNLRNTLTHHAPYVHKKTLQLETMRYQRRNNAHRATWPCLKGKTKVSRLYNDQDKCFEMQSIEGAAKVQLHVSGKVVNVLYSVEVKTSDADGEANSSHAYYTTINQSFAMSETPEMFKYPVRVLLKAKAAWDQNKKAEVEYNRKSDTNVAVSHLPSNVAFTSRPAFSYIDTRHNSLDTHEQSNCWSLPEILRVATIPSKLMYQRMVAEVIGDQGTLFVSRRTCGHMPEILVQLNDGASLLTACDGFYTWFDETGHIQHRFTRETIPPSIEIKGSGSSLTSLLQHINYVLQAIESPASLQDRDLLSSPKLAIPEKLELVNEVENKHGCFRAFRDGRIRAAFSDRTILQVEHNGDRCSFVFPDGTTGQATLASAPFQYRSYIYQALEFGDWAFASQVERMQRHEKRQQTQAIVAQELQRIHIHCEISNEMKGILLNSRKDLGHRTFIDASSMTSFEVQDLQAMTQAHMLSVDQVLQGAASVAANPNNSPQKRY